MCDPVIHLQICPEKAQKTFSSLMHGENSGEERQNPFTAL